MHHWVCPFRTSSVAASLPYLTLVYPASRWVQMGTHWRHSALSVASSSASSQVMSMSFESRLVMSIQFFHGRIFAAYFIKLFWSRNRSHIATHLLVVGAMLFRKPDVSNQIGIVLQVNTGKHRMTVSDSWYGVILSRWRPWRPPAAQCCICSSIHRLPTSPSSAWHWLTECTTVPDP